MEQQQTNQSFTGLVSLFLAEVIRSRKTSIARAAEISRRVVRVIDTIQSETEALSLLNDLEKDFEEVVALKQVIHFGHSESEIKVYEKEIKLFAAHLFEQDMVSSAKFLQDAAQSGGTIQHLCLQYPEFCSFLVRESDKGAVVASFQ